MIWREYLRLRTQSRVIEHDLEALRRVRRRGFKPRLIFDIGSSTGFWSLHVRRIFPEARFVLFEPLLSVRAHYRDMFPGLLAQQKNFQVEPIALSDTNGTVRLHETFDGWGSTILDWKYTELTKQVHDIPAQTLASWIKNHQSEIPQFIKLDTQGSELRILKGLGPLLGEVELLLIETWQVRGYAETNPLLNEIQSFLEDFQFTLYEVTGIQPSPGRPIGHDCLFVNERSPLARWHWEDQPAAKA